jgi:LacI family transcriptional regulator
LSRSWITIRAAQLADSLPARAEISASSCQKTISPAQNPSIRRYSSEARNHNFYILLTTVDTLSKKELAIPRFLLERNVDGVIIAGKMDTKLVDYVERLDIPLILVDFRIPGRRVSTVMIDNRKGVRLAIEHLAERGHTRIAFVGGDPGHPSISERFQGYRETLEELRLPFDANLVVTSEVALRVEDGFHALRTIFEREGKPTAVFAANDAMAIGCIQYAKHAGLQIPRDLAVVGFDDVESTLHVDPRLTTVRVFKEEMGALAVRRLVEAVKSKSRNIVDTYVPVELIVRESTMGRTPGDGVPKGVEIPEMQD